MERTCDIIALFNFGLALVCLVFNMGIQPLTENKKFVEELEKYKKPESDSLSTFTRRTTRHYISEKDVIRE